MSWRLAKLGLLSIVLVCFHLPAVYGASVSKNPLEVDPRAYLDRIELPPGFRIAIYQDGVEGARSMALGSRGTLFVGTRNHPGPGPGRKGPGRVYAVTSLQGGETGRASVVIAQGLNVPNGVVYRDGDLYVAELHQVTRYDDIESRLNQPPAPVLVNNSFPTQWHHGWKYLRFGPDGRLYVPVGAPCNICEPAPGEGAIVSMAPDGSDRRVFASGVRNSVGFDWDPVSGDMWFTDNGRDIWGDDIPPEELNHAPRQGMHFGFPYRYGTSLVDEEFETGLTDADFSPAAMEFPAHNALLGMRFYTGKQFPQDYHGDLFIASHGSWNRSVPDGYRIFRVRMENGRAVDYEVFAQGWLTPEKKYWGRPVDIEVMTDGSLLVSDDFAGVIYRISYEP